MQQLRLLGAKVVRSINTHVLLLTALLLCDYDSGTLRRVRLLDCLRWRLYYAPTVRRILSSEGDWQTHWLGPLRRVRVLRNQVCISSLTYSRVLSKRRTSLKAAWSRRR